MSKFFLLLQNLMEIMESRSSILSPKKEVKIQELKIVWGFYVNKKFREAHPEILKWISLDLTHMSGTFNSEV